MAADENSMPRHRRHAAPRTDDGVREGSVEELFEEVRAAAYEDAPPYTSDSGVTDEAQADRLAEEGSATLSAGQTDRQSVPDESSADVQVDGDQELQMGDAPTPIGIDPDTNGSFQRITADQGARVTTRANVSETASRRARGTRPIEAVRMSSKGRPHVERHETSVESNTRVFAIIGVAVVLVVAVLGWLLVRALVSVDEPEETVVAEQVQVGVGEELEYRGETYKIAQQDNGVYALTRRGEDQEEAVTVCTLTGVPVALILYNTAFVIPENLNNDTWDLIAHHLGSGSMTQQVTGPDGSALIGNGEIVSARLEGSKIIVETANGAEPSIVSLESD